MILVTGATGFVGQHLVKDLMKSGHDVRACSREKNDSSQNSVELFPIGNISDTTQWHQALNDVDIVIHTAARVHIMGDSAADPLAEFRKVNTAGTLTLAKQAAEADVKRFIFLSSIKVNGEMTAKGQPFSPDDQFIPTDPYGLSKYEAEQGLLKLAKQTGMEVVIIRPPLVYGPGVKANFAAMMTLASKGIPLPFGSVDNRRSLVALENLVSFITHCIEHPKAANEVFLISDDEDVSTTELFTKAAKATGKKPRLIPVPVTLMKSVAKLMGKSDVADRLLGSLQVDSSKARELLGWRPVISMDEQLKKTAAAYMGETSIWKRLFDISLVLITLPILIWPILLVAAAIKLTSKGPALYWSDRVGVNNTIFKMPKFRSMKVDTPAVATHLLPDPKSVLTPIGDFLRKSSLDELPQIWNILKGDMSFVGPRPALFNQDDLITLRTEKGVDKLVPGLTGWAQINGRDELPISDKVDLDKEYLTKRNFFFDLQILWLTFLKVIKKDGISH